LDKCLSSFRIKTNFMKEIRILAILLFMQPLIFCHAQTYLGATIGGDLMKEPLTPWFKETFRIQVEENNKGYRHESVFVGLKVEQKLINQFSLSLTSSFTRKTIRNFYWFPSTFYPMIGKRFDLISNYFELKRKVTRRLEIGLGGGYNFLRNDNERANDSNWTSGYRNSDEIGMVSSLSYRFDPILIEFSYFHGLRNLNALHTNYAPTSSFRFSASYMFKVFERGQTNKVNCPKI